MRYKNTIFILLILVSCTTQRIATSSKLMIFSIDSDTKFSENHEVRVDYKGIYNENYKFEVIIRNKSTDSIFVNPASFKYSLTSEIIGTDSKFIPVINPEARIEQLEIQEDSLKNKKNPYSLTNKSVKKIVTEGLVSGTIGLIFSQNGEELESQRQVNEHDWEYEHNLQLTKVNEELIFWNNNALLPIMIPPQNEVSGKVLFPVSLITKEIKIEIPIQNDVYNFRYKQSN
jgi:hypothetical protein